MSWNALIFNGRDVPQTLVGASSDWRPYPIGSPQDVIGAIDEAAANISWTPAGYGTLDQDHFSIELHVEVEEEVIDSIGVRVVGDGEPVPVLFQICKSNGWVLFDNQRGDLINTEDLNGSWNRFVEWRDKATNKEE